MKSVEEQKALAQEKLRQKRKLYYLLFVTNANGREVLADLKYRFDHMNDGTDAVSLARYEGRRDVIKEIEDFITQFERETDG